MEVQHRNVPLPGPHRLTQNTQIQDNIVQRISGTQVWENGRAHSQARTLCQDQTPDLTLDQTLDQTNSKSHTILVHLRPYQTISDNLRLSHIISDHLLRPSQNITDYFRLSQTISDHLRPSQTFSDHLRISQTILNLITPSLTFSDHIQGCQQVSVLPIKTR